MSEQSWVDTDALRKSASAIENTGKNIDSVQTDLGGLLQEVGEPWGDTPDGKSFYNDVLKGSLANVQDTITALSAALKGTANQVVQMSVDYEKTEEKAADVTKNLANSFTPNTDHVGGAGKPGGTGHARP